MRTQPEGSAPPAGMRAGDRTQLQECFSVLQPPLPLQLFFPAQPLSPDLQPPLFAHELCVAQACFSIVAVAPDEALEFWDLQPASGAPASMAATAVATRADLFFSCMMDRWMGFVWTGKRAAARRLGAHGYAGCAALGPLFPDSESGSAGRDRPSRPGQRAHALHELRDPERLDHAVVDAVGERPEDVRLAPAGRDQQH